MIWAKAQLILIPFPLQLKQEAIQRLRSQFLNRNAASAHSQKILIYPTRALAQKITYFSPSIIPQRAISSPEWLGSKDQIQ
ncbi:hypothetical protein CLV31_104213 [Algoriphagus aquaeductus]|uniref:Uncharacterized protein n=1 Tax=Algoriphagus aquaeductus TaxID=475299 RepID=A0A326RS94_9BACT|nr:hypothetical protein CLV31_104213 [Algoriphagus aquaeductus]